MSKVAQNSWPRRTVAAAAAALTFFAGAVTMKPAEAAFVSVGVGIPGSYYGPAPACAYYYPYGCYGYPVHYYAPAAVVAGGWGWGGWGGQCWGCGPFFHDGRFFFRDGRFVHDGRFFHAAFGRPGSRGGFGGPDLMRGGFGGGRR